MGFDPICMALDSGGAKKIDLKNYSFDWDIADDLNTACTHALAAAAMSANGLGGFEGTVDPRFFADCNTDNPLKLVMHTVSNGQTIQTAIDSVTKAMFQGTVIQVNCLSNFWLDNVFYVAETWIMPTMIVMHVTPLSLPEVTS